MNTWTLVVEHPAFFYSLAVVLGLLVGSFLNVLAYRLPIMLERQWQREAQAVLGLPGPRTSASTCACRPLAAPIANTGFVRWRTFRS